MNRMKKRIASAAAVVGMAASVVLGGAATASANTHPEDAPPGYGGPFSTCKGAPRAYFPLEGTSGYVQVWLSSEGSGTYCAMTFDNLPGDHHTEVILQHAGWASRWYDSGMYSTYAGGIYVSDANTLCAYVYGEVTVNGVPHTLHTPSPPTRYGVGWNIVC